MNRLDDITTSVLASDMAGAAAERLLVNGKFYQGAGVEHASWLRIVDSTIAELGSGSPPAPSHDMVQVVDLKGRFVLPGLHDAHIHTYSVGEASFFVHLGGCESIDELKQRVKQHADAHNRDKDDAAQHAERLESRERVGIARALHVLRHVRIPAQVKKVADAVGDAALP